MPRCLFEDVTSILSSSRPPAHSADRGTARITSVHGSLYPNGTPVQRDARDASDYGPTVTVAVNPQHSNSSTAGPESFENDTPFSTTVVSAASAITQTAAVDLGSIDQEGAVEQADPEKLAVHHSVVTDLVRLTEQQADVPRGSPRRRADLDGVHHA